ncbi:efflux RND transporter permease subunit [Chromohalobacter sp. TMW 2.2308]|uniref:Efflux RND transporter permease subunit n=1 Tax=Chromohalobacter moromii TaxID=2860329 RepID=A0A9X2WYV8_9GAMM|nr:efflux RND transporter permease subunit [Chromohalobacter moromii]MCK2044922.1 efflux RND transporter permease subunit [Chromohalobacter moromii]MCT8503929.1 efflux RND transporter permease subunit [Chromohalobacter moromii]MCT8514149.1 efflux RND transporter permease subunit [Chromohalobacter sp. TMW 2.2271]
MSVSSPFVRRPVGTALLALGIVLLGLLAYQRLPVAPLPNVSFPTIVVNASLSGANPETMASTVATPLERSLGTISGISQMTSSSSDGSTRVVVQFDLDKDIDDAAREVQAAINDAQPLLPSAMTSRPSYRKMNPAAAPIMILSVTSDTLPTSELYQLADERIAPPILQVPGVGDVNVGGSSSPAVRVSLDPRRLEHAGVSLTAVANAIRSATTSTPTGFVASPATRWEVDTDSQLMQAEAFEDLIVARGEDGAVMHLSDVADIENGVEDRYNVGFQNEQPAVLLIISASSGANVIDTIAGIRERMASIESQLPQSASLSVQLDRAPGIRASLHETQLTLMLAIALVVLVVFLFLRNARATLIPSLAIPVSLIGTFAMMHVMGFSLDTLSLMALIVSIGFLVDDAIVVVENIARHIEQGMPSRQAALQGAREVGFTVTSMSVSLVAVFLPLLFMGGFIGRMFFEFAMTLSLAVLVSLVVSLTLTPMLCARWLRPGRERQPPRWETALLAFGQGCQRLYTRSLDIALRHRCLTLLSLLGVIVLNGYLYVAVDKGFIPEQDTGRLIGFVRGDQSLSFDAMSAKLRTIRERLSDAPEVHSVLGFMGGRGGGASATLFITLEEGQREAGTQAIGNRLGASMGDIPGVNTSMMALQDIRIGGRENRGTQYEITLKSDDLALLDTWSQRVSDAMQDVDGLTGVDSDSQGEGQAVELNVDRDTAKRLGVDMQDVDTLLGNAFAQRSITSLFDADNQRYVILEVGDEHRSAPEAISRLHVINDAGDAIPVSAFSHLEESTTPVSVNHQGQFASTTVSFNLEDGVTLGDATQRIRRTVDDLRLPTAVQVDFEGSAGAFQSGMQAMPWLLLAALVTVYLVLGILYESYIHPLTILSTLPSAGVGALLALMLLDTPFTLIALIGIILLIGVVKKNAIMLVDFAVSAERERGLSALDAIREAAVVRFRPIMMTTLAAILGAIPLLLGTDENAALRAPLGITIIGGLILSQVLTLYTTPVVYLYLDRLHRRLRPARLENASQPTT